MIQQVATQKKRTVTPLEQVQHQIMSPKFAEQVKMALPEHISIDKFQRVVLTALAKTPSLVTADRSSLFTACVEAASDGLLPNGREAALVIYKTKGKDANGREGWFDKVQYMPMIAGIHKKARNSGEVKSLAAFTVCENDEFDYELGFEPVLKHKPALKDRGPVYAVYAVATMGDGTKDLEVMSIAEIEQVRQASKTKDKGPWVQWWDEMARKTAVRRLSKRLPLTPDLERTINRMDAMYDFEQGKEQKQVEVNATRPALGFHTATEQMNAFAGPVIENEPVEPPHDPKTGEVEDEAPDLSPDARAAFGKLSAAPTPEDFQALLNETQESIRKEIGGAKLAELSDRFDN